MTGGIDLTCDTILSGLVFGCITVSMTGGIDLTCVFGQW